MSAKLLGPFAEQVGDVKRYGSVTLRVMWRLTPLNISWCDATGDLLVNVHMGWRGSGQRNERQWLLSELLKAFRKYHILSEDECDVVFSRHQNLYFVQRLSNV